jgi:hypothetical protein
VGDEKSSNVVSLNTSGLSGEELAEHLVQITKELELESLVIVGIGRRQSVSFTLCNLPYDPARMLGAMDMARGRVMEAANYLLGTDDDDMG